METEFDIIIRRGLIKRNRDNNTVLMGDKPEIPRVIKHFLYTDKESSSLYVFPVFRRTNVFTGWADPHPRGYRFDLATGKASGVMEFDHRITSGVISKDKCHITGWSWTWACETFPQITFPFSDDWFAEQTPTYHVVEADFWETDPRRLAEFEPLSDLNDTWDLSVHAKRLNDVIDSPDRRRALIDRYRAVIEKRNVGCEPMACRVLYLLDKENRTEREEKYLTRQLMSFWRGSEPQTHLRVYHQPTAMRMNLPVKVNLSTGRSVFLGECASRVLVAESALPYRRLAQLRWLPKFLSSSIDVFYSRKSRAWMVGEQNKDYEVFDAPRLIDYLLHIVQRERDCFGISKSDMNLAAAFDGDQKTICEADTWSEPNSIGMDFGYPRPVNRIRILPAPGTEAQLTGALIICSAVSEIRGGKVAHFISEPPEAGKPLEIVLDAPVSGRWWRLTLPAGQKMSIAEIEFGFDMKTLTALPEEKDLHPGLRRTLYRGVWDQLPDFSLLQGEALSPVTGKWLADLPVKNGFGIVMEGLLRIPEAGKYRFYTTSDDGSRLKLHSLTFVDNDGKHSRKTAMGTVMLTPGLHPIRVEFFDKDGSRSLDIDWKTPGGTRQPLTGAVLFHHP